MISMEQRKENTDVFNQNRNYNMVQAFSKIQQGTPQEMVERRDDSGYLFINGDSVIHMLNGAFNYQWSFETADHQLNKGFDFKNNEQPSIINVLGRMTVPGLGVREQWGSSVMKGKSDIQSSAYKAASTDAMKKCASMFGIGIDVTTRYNPRWQSYHVGPQDIKFVTNEDIRKDFNDFMGIASKEESNVRKEAEQEQQGQVHHPEQNEQSSPSQQQTQQVNQQQEQQQPQPKTTNEEKVMPANNEPIKETISAPTQQSQGNQQAQQQQQQTNTASQSNRKQAPVLTKLGEVEANELRKAMMQAGFNTVEKLEASPIIKQVTNNSNATFADIDSQNVGDIVLLILENTQGQAQAQ